MPEFSDRQIVTSWHTNARPWTDFVQNTEIENLLPDNLLALNRDIGELKGQAHTHTPS